MAQHSEARAAWIKAYSRAREAADREGAGLLPHPENAQIDCPTCEGAGEWIEHTADPQDEVPTTCDRCMGSGTIIDGHVDPLILLHSKRWRLQFRCLGNRAIAQFAYESMRRRAYKPCCGLAMADMRAMAARCVNETERGVALMRGAA